MSNAPSVPRVFTSGHHCSFTPIFPSESLPAFLSFLNDIHCFPEFSISMAGQLFLRSRDGGYVPCPSEFLDWMQALQPNSYPVPVGLTDQSSVLHASRSVQADVQNTVPSLLAGLTNEKLEQLLMLKDVYKFARECYAVVGKELLLKMTKNAMSEKVYVAVVDGEVVAEKKSTNALEANKLTSLEALRRLHPSLADQWTQRH